MKLLNVSCYLLTNVSDVVVANCAQKFHFVLNFPATRDNEAHYGCNIAVHHLKSEGKKMILRGTKGRIMIHVQVNCTGLLCKD